MNSKPKFFSRKSVIISVIIIIIFISLFFLSRYIFLVKKADLLTDWKTSGGFISRGSSRYKIINSSNGQSTYIPKFLLGLVNYENRPTYEELDTQRSRIIDKYPEFDSNATMCGFLNEDIVVVGTYLEDGTYAIVLYDMLKDTYDIALYTGAYAQAVAGHNKIFILGLPEGVSRGTSIASSQMVGYGGEKDIISVDDYYQPIYYFNPDTKELVVIGEYNSLIEHRNLILEMVVK